MDTLAIFTASLAVLIVAGLVALGVWSGKVEFRPIRTSALGFGAMLLALVWLGLTHDFNLAVLGISDQASAVVNMVVDVSVFMVAATGYVTSMTKLSDDGGESDTIKALREFVALLKTRS